MKSLLAYTYKTILLEINCYKVEPFDLGSFNTVNTTL